METYAKRIEESVRKLTVKQAEMIAARHEQEKDWDIWEDVEAANMGMRSER